MKQTYLKSLFLSLLMIVVGSISANAEEETIATFTASEYNSGTTGGWTVSNADYATAGGGYYKLITSDASIVTPSINWSNYSDITITISARKFGGPDATQGKISVSQGETELTSYSPSGTSIVASSALEISPADGTITISCPGASSSKGCGVGSIIIKGTPAVSKTLSSISLSGTYPTTFKVGDTFSHEGMIVTANYDDNTSEDVTAYATFEGYDMSTAGEQEVTVSYTKGEVTKTATYDITVENVLLTGITLSGDYPTTFTVGDAFSHEGMTVTANYNDNTSEDVTADATFNGYDMSTAGDQEVTVSYTKGEVTKTAAYNITVNALTGDAYTLVTNVADLADGDNVIIVNKDAGKAISTTQATNNRPATGITFDADGNAIVPSSTAIQVFTLEGNTEGWYFNTGSGYIYAASSSNNHLKTETEADDNAKATISISDGDATIQFQGSNTRNLLKYNSGSSIFSCYASGQQPVQIYSKPVNKTLTGIMLSGEYPTTFFVGDEFSFGETGTVTAVYDDNSTKVVTELATFSGYDMNTA
ncbi:MAG: bacterial Ig-like domain-containing protein, partial [Prevotella sp.]|nr:bacterial Ig-like domain-containing protein [Prevotella sp.]